MRIGYKFSPDSLRLFAWHEVDNFGDRLGPALFAQISGRPVYVEARGLQPTFQGPAREIHCFLGTLAQVLAGPHHFVLWGFGASPADGPAHHGCRPMPPGLDLEIRALRGELTRQVLEQAGYVIPKETPYGDPGLLIPAFYDRSPVQVNDFCIVPHHSDYDRWRWEYPGFNVIDIRTPTYESLQALILEITKYRLVFTSSLHVSVLAEAFGVPVQPVTPKLSFKLDDFYSGVGKRVEYLSNLTPGANWPALYRAALRNWRPVRWDPAPWLAAAPFPISPRVRQLLTRHYSKLAATGRPSQGFSFMWAKRKAYYRAVQAAITPAQPVLESKAHTAQVFGPEAWTFSTATAGEMMRVEEAGARLHAAMPRHIATDFISAAGAAEVIARIPLDQIEGSVEILIQNDQYVTRSSTSLHSGDPPGIRTLSVVPEDASERLRVCVMVLRGGVTVGPIEIGVNKGISTNPSDLRKFHQRDLHHVRGGLLGKALPE